MSLAIALIAAYLLGSIPTSYLAGRLGAGIDLREHGSRSLGATNVWRLLGPRYAVPVGLFDVAKGAVAALVMGRWGGDEPWLPLVTGGAAILGHVFPAFLAFRGGKGVATAAGVLLAVAPLPVLAAAAAWGFVLFLTGYVSAGSLTAAVVFPVASWLLHPEDVYTLVAGVILGGFVFFTHRANIRRLLDGTESRFHRGHKEGLT